ncbi:NADH-quinone oxidoreductase subunit M [Candidatus Poribacteria bacterium]|nr:NADH-quinone oxidoreductase subunit M [Candidatus Poribacteria bacterium]
MILTWTVFLPLVGAALIAVAGALARNVSDRALRDSALKVGALAVSLLAFLLSLPFALDFAATEREVVADWIPAIGSSFHLRLDGISVWLFVLTTFLTPICILASWNSIAVQDDADADHRVPTEKGVAGFLASLLVLETAMLGTFVAYDLLLFFVFWELMLIPMYFLIGVWGSPGVRSTFLFGKIKERVYATLKFVLYTMAGSALMLVGILWLRLSVGTFDLADITRHAATIGFARSAQFWLFWAFFVAFAIKVPLFPFHTWLPDAHVQAPTAGSVILAGVLLKMGTYGIIRFCLPLFPEAALFYAPTVSVLAVIGIIYGALVAMVQPDMKKLVAYSSVSHLGFVVLGLFSGNDIGVQGAVLQMVNHGLSTGALFLLVGMIYERRHTRTIADFGGLAKPMPAYAAFFIIVTLSSIGLPGLNGFVGEFLILLGTFMTEGRAWFAVLAATGVILAAVYMLWMVQRVFFGKVVHPENESLRDLSFREIIVLLPIVLMAFVIGFFPKPFLALMNAEDAIGSLRKAGATREVAAHAAPMLIPEPEDSHTSPEGGGNHE